MPTLPLDPANASPWAINVLALQREWEAQAGHPLGPGGEFALQSLAGADLRADETGAIHHVRILFPAGLMEGWRYSYLPEFSSVMTLAFDNLFGPGAYKMASIPILSWTGPGPRPFEAMLVVTRQPPTPPPAGEEDPHAV